ncbi:cation transporter [Janibacter indicus]
MEGVSDVSVEIPNGRLTVHSTPTVTDEAVHAAIGQAGYTIAASA